jgi:hypothetical protein
MTAIFFFPYNSICQEIDKFLFITRIGTFLIERQKDPHKKIYLRTGYVPIGTVVYSDGDPFDIRTAKNDYEPVKYLPIITEGGIQAAILMDCLFKPKESHLIVPQHFADGLSFRSDHGNVEFSRSDGLFAEVAETFQESYSVIFPFKPSGVFTQVCGPCPEEKYDQKEGYILADEIEQEQARVLMPKYYHKSDVPRFSEVISTTNELVDALIKCMDGTVFPKPSEKVLTLIKQDVFRFYNVLTGCGLKADADASLRGELFGAGGGLVFTKNLKPENRKFSLKFYTFSNGSGEYENKFLLIRRLKCEEDKPTQLARLTMFDLTNHRSFDLLACELSKNINLKHLPRGDDRSRDCMINIGKNSGHDDVFKIYRYLFDSNDFQGFVAASGFDDHRNRRMRAYLDFLVTQIADFRR